MKEYKAVFSSQLYIILAIVSAIVLLGNTPTFADDEGKVKQTAGQDTLGEFTQRNANVLFGKAGPRADKQSLKTRSIVTLSTLIGKGINDSSLKKYLIEAKKNGVTQTEMAEILTQAAFCAELPDTWPAFKMANELYADNTPKPDYASANNADLTNRANTVRAQACRDNLKQYESGKQQWALENKKDADAIPTKSDLIGRTLYLKAEPTCPCGGTYTIGNMSTDPTCSIGTSLGASNTAWHHILTK